MAIKEIIKKAYQTLKEQGMFGKGSNLANVKKASNASEIHATSPGIYNANNLNAKLVELDLHDAKEGFFRFENFWVFGGIQEILDAYALRHNLKENFLESKTIFESKTAPLQFFDDLRTSAKNNAEAATNRYTKELAKVLEFCPGLSQLVAVQARQRMALNTSDASTLSLISGDVRAKIEQSIETNSYMQQLILTAMTGLHSLAVNEKAIRGRSFNTADAIFTTFEKNKPNLISRQYLTKLFERNFAVSNNFQLTTTHTGEVVLNVFDNSGNIIENPSEVITVSQNSDKAFDSLEHFLMFANTLAQKTPKEQFDRYSTHLTGVVEEKLKEANQDFVHSKVSREALWHAIIQNNFNLPENFDSFKIEHDEYEIDDDYPSSTLVLYDKNGEKIDENSITLKDEGDNLFMDLWSFSQYYVAMKNSNISDVMSSYYNRAKEKDKKVIEDTRTGRSAKTAAIRELFARNFISPEAHQLRVDANMQIDLIQPVISNENGDKLFDNFNQFKEFMHAHLAQENDITVEGIIDNYSLNYNAAFKENIKNYNISEIASGLEEAHASRMNSIASLKTNIITGNYEPLKYEPKAEKIDEKLNTLMTTLQKQMIQVAEEDLHALPEKYRAIEKLANEKELLENTEELKARDQAHLLNKLSLDSSRYALYNEILEGYEDMLENQLPKETLELIKARESESNRERKDAFRENRQKTYFGDISAIISEGKFAYDAIKESMLNLQLKKKEIERETIDQFHLASTVCASPIPLNDGSDNYRVFKGGGLNKHDQPGFNIMSFEETKKWYTHMPKSQDLYDYLELNENEKNELIQNTKAMTKEEFDVAILNNQLVHAKLPEFAYIQENFLSQVAQIEKYNDDIADNLWQDIQDNYQVHDNKILNNGEEVTVFSERELRVISNLDNEIDQKDAIFAKLISDKNMALIANVRFNEKGEMLVLKEDGSYEECFSKDDVKDIEERINTHAEEHFEKFSTNYLNKIIENNKKLAAELTKESNYAQPTTKEAEEKEQATSAMDNATIVEVINIVHPSQMIEFDMNHAVKFLQGRKKMNLNEIEKAAKAVAKRYIGARPLPKLQPREVVSQIIISNEQPQMDDDQHLQDNTNTQNTTVQDNEVHDNTNAQDVTVQDNEVRDSEIQDSEIQDSSEQDAFVADEDKNNKTENTNTTKEVELENENHSQEQEAKKEVEVQESTELANEETHTKQDIDNEKPKNEQDNNIENEKIKQDSDASSKNTDTKTIEPKNENVTADKSSEVATPTKSHETNSKESNGKTQTNKKQGSEQTAEKPKMEQTAEKENQTSPTTSEIIKDKLDEGANLETNNEHEINEDVQPFSALELDESKKETAHELLKTYFLDTALHDTIKDDEQLDENFAAHNYNIGESFDKWLDNVIKEKGENLDESIREYFQKTIIEKPYLIKRFAKDKAKYAKLVSGVQEKTANEFKPLTPETLGNINKNFAVSIEGRSKFGKVVVMDYVQKEFHNTEVLDLMKEELSPKELQVGLEFLQDALTAADQKRLLVLENKLKNISDQQEKELLKKKSPTVSTPSIINYLLNQKDKDGMGR